jgi:hypothetical protein
VSPEEQLGGEPEPRPFLEDGSEFGISEDAFREMDEESQHELMLEWFRQNFEDPHNELPFKEGGGNLFLWGGPFDAKEVMSDKFGHIVNESVADAIVTEIERNGVLEWAPTSSSPYYDNTSPMTDRIAIGNRWKNL